MATQSGNSEMNYLDICNHFNFLQQSSQGLYIFGASALMRPLHPLEIWYFLPLFGAQITKDGNSERQTSMSSSSLFELSPATAPPTTGKGALAIGTPIELLRQQQQPTAMPPVNANTMASNQSMASTSMAKLETGTQLETRWPNTSEPESNKLCGCVRRSTQ